MKALFLLAVSLITVNVSAQELQNESSFSKVYFGILGGTNFNTLPTAGTAINIEVKTNLTSKILGKISIGYSTLFNDNSYQVRSSSFVNIDDFSKYVTRLLVVDRIKYTIIPVSIGAEYSWLDKTFTPTTFLEVGYNISSSLAEGTTFDGIAGYFDTISEVPEEYKEVAPPLNDGSSFTMGIGVGLKYRLTDRMDLNLRYMYHYNDSIVNNNQLLFGVTF